MEAGHIWRRFCTAGTLKYTPFSGLSQCMHLEAFRMCCLDPARSHTESRYATHCHTCFKNAGPFVAVAWLRLLSSLQTRMAQLWIKVQQKNVFLFNLAHFYFIKFPLNRVTNIVLSDCYGICANCAVSLQQAGCSNREGNLQTSAVKIPKK